MIELNNNNYSFVKWKPLRYKEIKLGTGKSNLLIEMSEILFSEVKFITLTL